MSIAEVTPDSMIGDVLASHPMAAEVFRRYGLGCPSCLGAGMESVSTIASSHDVAIEDLIRDLNDMYVHPVGEELSHD